MKKIDLVGSVFGELAVISEASEGRKRVHWLCKCRCGSEVVIASNNLCNGHSTSCGCSKKKAWATTITTHGLSRLHKAEYGIWKKMKARCNSKSDRQYSDYGGRGIYVDEAWLNFSTWLSDMGKRPSPSHSLNRIDNDGPYAKWNCEWATPTEQANNRRSSKFIEVGGERMTVAQASARFGIKYGTLQMRLKRHVTGDAAIGKVAPNQ